MDRILHFTSSSFSSRDNKEQEKCRFLIECFPERPQLHRIEALQRFIYTIGVIDVLAHPKIGSLFIQATYMGDCFRCAVAGNLLFLVVGTANFARKYLDYIPFSFGLW